MRALINAASLYGKGAGARTYTAGLLTALRASDADMQWDVHLRESDYQRLGLATDPRFHRLPFRGPAAPPGVPGVRFLWRNALDQVIMPAYARHYDAVHYLDSYGPIVGTGATAFALTVHDLFPITHPEYFSPWVARYLAYLMRAIPRAAALMAISEETRRELTRVFQVAPERVRVIYNGVDPRFHPATEAERQAVAAKYRIQRPYLLFVGSVESRKNVARLIRSFARARGRAEHTCDLLIAGKPGFGYEEVVAAIGENQVGDAVRLLGYVPDEDVTPLMSGALALVYLSLAEGFGLPVIEGMACGAPVITSATGALAEVAGDAAYLVNPTDEEAIAAAMVHVCQYPGLQARLRALSLERAQKFSWAAVASAAIEAYRAAAVRRPSSAR